MRTILLALLTVLLLGSPGFAKKKHRARAHEKPHPAHARVVKTHAPTASASASSTSTVSAAPQPVFARAATDRPARTNPPAVTSQQADDDEVPGSRRR
jgi:hypothetical protein